MGTRRQQQARMLEYFEKRSWKKELVERSRVPWADEFWMLRSSRSNSKAWLVFLVDPEWRGKRQPGEAVHAIAVDLARRNEAGGWLFQIPLGRRWERGMEELLDALDAASLNPPRNGG